MAGQALVREERREGDVIVLDSFLLPPSACDAKHLGGWGGLLLAGVPLGLNGFSLAHLPRSRFLWAVLKEASVLSPLPAD